MEAIVLAGGLGTRLRSVVADVPKPMAPVGGRPFLGYVLDQLVSAGFTTVVLAVGYRHEAIRDHFGDEYRSLSLRYSVEAEPLGTGGAIRLASERIGPNDVFVLNGDTYLELDFRAMLAAHMHAGASLTMAICRVSDVARYGALEIGDGIVRRFHEKGPSGPGWINGGTYVLGPGLRDRFPAQMAFSLEQDVLAPQVTEVRPLAFPADGIFIDIGVPEDFARAQAMFRLSR